MTDLVALGERHVVVKCMSHILHYKKHIAYMDKMWQNCRLITSMDKNAADTLGIYYKDYELQQGLSKL